MKRILTIALALALPGCVLVAHPAHPHGGPPGQVKKEYAHHHNGHCGHKRKKDKNGHWVYMVEGRWVVVID